MKIGILQSSLEPDDLAGSFELASKAGAEGIELVCASRGHVRTTLSGAGARRVQEWKSQYGLEVPGIVLGILSQTESLFGAPPVAEAARDLIHKAMDAAGQIGTGVLVLPFLGKSAIESEEELDRVVDALPELAEQSEQSGLTLGIETTLNADQQRHLLEHLSAYTSVKVRYDAATPLTRKTDPATWLRDLGRDRICQIQLRDVRLGEGGSPPDWDVALGAGDVDFPAVANAIAAIGYEGWIVLAPPATDDPLAGARANMEFARALLGQR